MDWRKIPSLSALRAFEAAARCGSFTKAAAELNVTQAGVAQHVRGLEKELDVSLILRQGRGIEITAEGRSLAESLSEGFRTISDGISALRDTTLTRSLCVATTPSFATHWLMPRIGDFWGRHPDIPVTLATSIEVVDFKRDGIDVAIRYGHGQWAGTTSVRLTDGDYWVIAHPDLLGDRNVTCAPDVQDLPWLLDTSHEERTRLISDQGVDFDKVDITLMHTNALVIAGVKAGLGVSVQPKSLIEQDVAMGTLHKVCALSHPTLGYHIVTQTGRQSEKLNVFMRWLQRQIDMV